MPESKYPAYLVAYLLPATVRGSVGILTLKLELVMDWKTTSGAFYFACFPKKLCIMHHLHLAMVYESFAMVSYKWHALQDSAMKKVLQNIAMQIGLQQRRRKAEHMLDMHSRA